MLQFSKLSKSITLNLPYSIGDTITVDNQPCKIIGLHLYVGEKGISTVRYYCGFGRFVSFSFGAGVLVE